MSCWFIATCFVITLEVLTGAQLCSPVLTISWCLCSGFFVFLLDTELFAFTVRYYLKSFCGQSRSNGECTEGNCLGWGGRSHGRRCPVSLPFALPQNTYAGLHNLHTRCLESLRKCSRVRVCQVLALMLQGWDGILWCAPLSLGLFWGN